MGVEKGVNKGATLFAGGSGHEKGFWGSHRSSGAGNRIAGDADIRGFSISGCWHEEWGPAPILYMLFSPAFISPPLLSNDKSSFAGSS